MLEETSGNCKFFGDRGGWITNVKRATTVAAPRIFLLREPRVNFHHWSRRMSTRFKKKPLLQYFQSEQSTEISLIGLSVRPNDYPNKILHINILP
ncbi:MAG: hypothetical protein V3V81_07835 [Candidatus Bathyarchaeia archaeon]